MNFGNDVFVIIVPYNIPYAQLMDRIEHKVSICGGTPPGPLRVRYEDEDGDYITMFTDDDVQMAFDSFGEHGGRGETVGVVTLTVAN